MNWAIASVVISFAGLAIVVIGSAWRIGLKLGRIDTHIETLVHATATQTGDIKTIKGDINSIAKDATRVAEQVVTHGVRLDKHDDEMKELRIAFGKVSETLVAMKTTVEYIQRQMENQKPA